MANCPPPEELININYTTPVKSWMDTKTLFKPGNFSYPTKPDILKYLGMPNPREWSPMMARDLLHEVGCNINWILEPVANCNRTGNHLGIQPQAFVDMGATSGGSASGGRGQGPASGRPAPPPEASFLITRGFPEKMHPGRPARRRRAGRSCRPSG